MCKFSGWIKQQVKQTAPIELILTSQWFNT